MENKSVTHVLRASDALRRGEWVVVQGFAQSYLVASAEIFNVGAADLFSKTVAASASLLLTSKRVEHMLGEASHYPALIVLTKNSWQKVPLWIAAKQQKVKKDAMSIVPSRDKDHLAILELIKLTEHLPAAVIGKIEKSKAKHYLSVAAREIVHFEKNATHALHYVTSAPLTLKAAKEASIHVFRTSPSYKEHYAIVIGDKKKQAIPLVRIHSACYTGDLLGSLACDCQEQLHSALKKMSEHGYGILLYLMQEGRGIGLVNKLRAYALKDRGYDTAEANEHLGFEDDERPFVIAANMLKALKVEKVELLTNNPRKISGLQESGVKVLERHSHMGKAHKHNRSYLKTKHSKLGHIA